MKVDTSAEQDPREKARDRPAQWTAGRTADVSTSQQCAWLERMNRN